MLHTLTSEVSLGTTVSPNCYFYIPNTQGKLTQIPRRQDPSNLTVPALGKTSVSGLAHAYSHSHFSLDFVKG